MPNLFDKLQDQCFDTSSKVFGYDATWNNDPAITGRVLFRKPTERELLMGQMGYDPRDFVMEYKEGDFEGLWESLRAGNLEEVTIQGTVYVARFVDAHFDGKTYKVRLEVKDPEPEPEP